MFDGVLNMSLGSSLWKITNYPVGIFLLKVETQETVKTQEQDVKYVQS